MYVRECVCVCLHVYLHVCVLSYVSMCTCYYMYLSTYSLHVYTCLHTHYMYLSTGDQSEAISTDPKISPVSDQLLVYGELIDSGQMVQNYC